MFLAQHGYVERIERHRMACRHNKPVTGSQLLYSAGSEMPEMTGNVVSRPILAVALSIIRRTVGYSYNQYSFFCQQLMKSLPHLIKMFQMFHHMPKGDNIKAGGSKLLQSRFGLHLQIEMQLRKLTCLRTLLHRFHFPATTYHRMGEITGSRTYIKQTPRLTMRFPGYQARFAAQHIGTYIMVNAIHRALARIRVGDIVGSLIILAYLCFHGDSLCECKSTVLTRIQFKLFARSIKIRASHDAFQVRTATHRTSIYTEFLH